MHRAYVVRQALAALIVLGAVVALIVLAVPARAVSVPSLESLRAVPAAVTQFESFSVTCATAAGGTIIAPATGFNFTSVYCENNSATTVYIGGSEVTSSSPCISTASATCLKSSISADVQRGALFCLGASSQAIKCLGSK